MAEPDVDDADEDSLSKAGELLRRIAAAPHALVTTQELPVGPARTQLEVPELGACVDGRYRLDELLGEGGMGVVFGATNLRTHGKVALKFIHRGGTIASADIARFEREARIGCSLQHPNVVRMFDAGASANGPYLVMERLTGTSLAQRLKGPPLPVAEVIRIVTAAARGVGHAHRLGFVHRDIKPGNIFLSAEHGLREPVPKLLDFGVSRLSLPSEDPDHSVTRSGTIVGTPAYMSLEQLRGQRVDARSDVFALGAVLFEALTGRLPIAADNPHDLAVRLATQTAPRLDTLRDDLPRHVVDACAKALAREPAERFSDALQFADALEGLAEAPPIRRTRTRTLAILLGVLSLTAIAWAINAWGTADPSPPRAQSTRPTEPAGMIPEPLSDKQRVRPEAPGAQPTVNAKAPDGGTSGSDKANPGTSGSDKAHSTSTAGVDPRHARRRSSPPSGPTKSSQQQGAEASTPPSAPLPPERARDLRREDF